MWEQRLRDGALAEVTSFLADLTPLPKRGSIKVTRLAVSTSRTLRLVSGDLMSLGVDMTRYAERDYALTQEIGSTLAWLNVDGLIAPSARWPCENLMIYTDNHGYGEKLERGDEEMVEWRTWVEEHGILKPAVKP